MKERVFMLMIDTKDTGWREKLSYKLDELCKELNSGIKIYELNDKGKKKAEKLLSLKKR
jgi:hypothetical protein